MAVATHVPVCSQQEFLRHGTRRGRDMSYPRVVLGAARGEVREKAVGWREKLVLYLLLCTRWRTPPRRAFSTDDTHPVKKCCNS